MSGGDQEPGLYYVGIDVGTGSVRAALVDQRGVLLAFAERPIKKWEPQFNHHEQSSEDIWAACCLVTKVRAKPWHPLPVHAPPCSAVSYAYTRSAHYIRGNWRHAAGWGRLCLSEANLTVSGRQLKCAGPTAAAGSQS